MPEDKHRTFFKGIPLTAKKYSFIFLKSIKINQIMIAEVAELVDALGSGSSRWTPVGVRVPSSAPES
jgi:hypothetical protein